MFFDRVALQIFQILLQPCVGVWVTMCNINGIVIVIKLQSKGKTAVIPSKFALHIVGVVAYLPALAHPSHSFRHRSLLRVYERLHAYVVETVGFEQIDDIEPIFHVFSGVGNREEVPLRVAIGVVISRQDEIVLKLQSKSAKWLLLDDPSEVAALEPRLKYQNGVFFGFR